jgi:hypothetical protein
MKQMTMRTVLLLQAFVGAGAAQLFAQSNYTGESVTCRTNETQLRQGEHYVPLTNDLTLARGIEVSTNCTYRVGEGKERALGEGQVLREDGFLLSSDGTMIPVRDHIEMSQGTVKVYRDGTASVLTSKLTLPDGTGINPDGSYTRSSGRRARLADGQMLTLDGIPIHGFDTISMHGGKVTVYKSGALIPLQSAVVIMGMADGTRVRGDGYITSPSGTSSQLGEGQTVTFPALRRDW